MMPTVGTQPAAHSDNSEVDTHDERGVDLTLLRQQLALTPLERLRRMERHARDIAALMAHGQRHREAQAP
jgi:hypothetical protein